MPTLPKILLIEDDPIIRDELQLLLSNAGYTVDTVTDFSDPLEQVHSFSPDLILLDINLPGQNGYTLCTSIAVFRPVMKRIGVVEKLRMEVQRV